MLSKYLQNLNEVTNSDDIQSKIIAFLTKNPKPSDSDIHDLAEELGISPHKFEEYIYELLGSLLKGVGKHRDRPDTDYDASELKAGIEVEYEHTDNAAIAKEIAKDHLAECSDYYRRLAKMESECEKLKKK